MTNYDIMISNCNSIDQASIQIAKGILNIKYGPNGLGKSTIAKAISSHVNDDGTLADLLPFKLRKINTEKRLKNRRIFGILRPSNNAGPPQSEGTKR